MYTEPSPDSSPFSSPDITPAVSGGVIPFNPIGDEPLSELFTESRGDFASAVQIHIRIQPMKNKYITIIEGIPTDREQHLRILRKKCAANGHLQNTVIILQGDQRDTVCNYILQHALCDEEYLFVHGY